MKARQIGLLVGLSFAAVGVWAARQPLINDVTTGQTPEYPDLRPHAYSQSSDAVFQAVQSVAASMSGWRITTVDPHHRVLHAEARVPLTPFTDDVTIRVDTLGSGSRVVMRSHSRVGRGDLGVNARRIRAFLRALDLKLGVPHRGVGVGSHP
jgi:uncharacterized protein (DUF1499 family)